MLAVDEVRAAVRRLASLQEQWVAFFAYRGGLEREHGTKSECARPEGALGHAHAHVVVEDFLVAAIATLLVVYQIASGVEHHHPRPTHDMDSLVSSGLRLPGRAGGLAGHGVWPIHTGHGHLTHLHAVHVHPRHVQSTVQTPR